MSDFKGTPGPWHIQDDHGRRWIETEGNDDTIAEIHRRRSKGGVYSCEEALANAKLIIAATDLFEALRECTSDLFYQIEMKHGPEFASKYPSIVAARAALTKVTS